MHFKKKIKEEEKKNPKKQTAAPSQANQKGRRDAIVECVNHLDFLFPKSYCPVSAAERGVKHRAGKSVLISATKNA